MNRSLILYLLFSAGVLSCLNGQMDPVLSDGISFRQYADSLEKSTGVKLFFHDSWVRDLRIPLGGYSWDLTPLDIILPMNKLDHIYLSEKQILIFPERQIFASFPDLFLSAEEVADGGDYTVSLDTIDTETAQVFNAQKLSLSIGSPDKSSRGKMVVISGKVTDRKTGEAVIGATVFSKENHAGTVTNAKGLYFLKLPYGTHELRVRFIGKKEVSISLSAYEDGQLNVEMEDQAMELKAVYITSNKFNNIESSQMGVSRIDTRMMGSIPVIGEIDIMKISVLLPGVQSVGEGTTGFNVRGGNTDQNLILLDNAPIFNPSHLMGFFSAFNAEVIRDFELHKSIIPARLGGRLASVMELNVKSGNKKELSGNAGISPLTGKFNIEGPILKDKFSFLLGGRSMYSNWLLKRIDNEDVKRSQASFYDMNSRLDYEINNNHTMSLSGYYSNDDFYKNYKDTLFQYTNASASLEWKFRINPSFVKNTSLVFSQYKNSITDHSEADRAYRIGYAINYSEYRSDFIYFLNNEHLMNFGISANYYGLSPGTLSAEGPESLVIPEKIENEQGSEFGIYVGDEYKVTPKLSMNGGIRYSLYTYFGPGSIYQYSPGLPLDISTLTDTLRYGKGEGISFYHSIEPRFLIRYILGNNLSVKAGYSRMRQNIHIMSNTFSVSPTDTWKLSDPNIMPQVADQFSAGLFKNFPKSGLETSVEGYYKRISGLKDYKVAATLLMNDHLETEIVECNGKAYGLEFLIRKPAGKLNGWFSYTWSRIFLRSKGTYKEEIINRNEWFPAIYDKPHSMALVGNYRFSRRISLASNLVYSTGRPITYPVAKYNFRNGAFLHYSDRNEYRIEDYFRWDLSFNLDGNLRTDQFAHNFWSLSVYNLTGRDNTYSIYFIAGGESVKGYKMSVFARPIVSLSYNFRF